MMMNIVIYVGIWWEMYAKCNAIVSVYIMFLSLSHNLLHLSKGGGNGNLASLWHMVVGRTIFRGKLRWGEDIFDATLGEGVKRFLAECKCRENANDVKW